MSSSPRCARTSPARHRPAGLLGQPQLGPLPHRHRCARWPRTASPGPPASSPAPTRRTPAAGSTARTSPTPSPQVDGRPAARQAAALLQPPRLRGRRWSTPRSPRSPSSPTRDREGAHLVFVTHSIPTAMDDTAGPHGGAYVAQHRSVADQIVERVAAETGHRYPGDLVFCSRSGSPARPVAGARRQRPPRRSWPAGRPGRRGGADRLRLRPHGGRLRPRHRGRGDGREARALRSSGPPPPASTRGSWRWSATCCWSGPPSSAARSVQRAAVGSLPPCWDVCPVGCCPNPRGREAGAGRGRTPDGRRPAAGPARAGPRDRPRGRRRWSRSGRPRGRDRGRHQVQRRRRRHRGRPGQRGADPRRGSWPPVPTTASSARRATSVSGDQRHPLGGRPDRRHRQLPLRHPGVRRVHRGAVAGRTVPETVAAVVVDVAHGMAYTATPGGGAFRDGVPPRGPGAGAAGGAAGAAPASTTPPTPGLIQAAAVGEAAAAGPRHPPAGLLRPRPVPRGGGVGGRLRRGGRRPTGTTPPAPWWPPRRAPSSS